MAGHILRPHQVRVLEQIRGQSRVALFMEMRLGKTPVIIQWATEQTADQPRPRILVVAPMATLDDWEEELRFAGVTDIHRLDRATTKTRVEYVSAAWGWFLVHFEAVRLTDELSEEEWDVIIVDESTHIRNPKAKITKRLLRDYQYIDNKAIMTGDPRPESELDYFCQMQFLHGNFMGFRNYWVFRNTKFKQSAFQEWDWFPRPGLRDEIKKYVHQHAVVLTAQQAGLGNKQIFQKRVVELNDAQRKAYREVVKDFSFEYIETNFATVRDIWLARIAGGFSPDRENPELLSGAKAEAIVDLMQGELRRKSSVIWFRFNEELEYVVKRLNWADIPTAGVSGITPKDDRKRIRDDFNRGRYRVLCVQIRLGRMGWNLARADIAQYYSNALDYESRAQSMKRIEHMTKKRPLLYIDWVTRGTIDEDVVRLLREKRMNSRAFMRQLNSAALDRLRRLYETETEENARTRPTARHQKEKVRRTFPGSR